ncbi:uncharacterized protein NPIL_219471, partial [Nephila pilipes]
MIRFWPSLQLIAHVRIAKGVLRILEFKNVLPDFLLHNASDNLQNMHQILSSLILPKVLENRTMGIIEALCKEIESWCYCHCLFLIGVNLDYWDRIQWYSHGNINRLETVRAFIQDENINSRERFNLACAYYLDVDVRNLWEKMSLGCKNYFIIQNTEYRRSIYWLFPVLSGIPLDWSQISETIEFDDFSVYDSRNFFYRNNCGLFQIFPKLKNAEARFRSILNCMLSNQLNPFDLYLCLFRMEDRELYELFNRLFFLQRLVIFRYFLSWPLQGFFLDILERFGSKTSKMFYLELFNFILRDKFKTEWFDHDYVDLVKEMWTSISPKIKSEIEKDTIFPYLKQVLDNDGRLPIP